MSDQDRPPASGDDGEAEQKAAERKRRQEEAFAAFDRQEAERKSKEQARNAAARAAKDASTRAQSPPPGWYPHPTMAATQRYWDGSTWTENIAPVNDAGRRPVDEKKLKAVAWGISLAFLLPVLFITFLASPTYGGETCGTWISPTWTDLELTLRQADATMGGGGAFEDARLATIADRCNTTLGTHRVICLILIGLGAGARLAVPAIVRAVRD